MTSWTGSSPVPRASQKITGRTGRHGRGVDDDVVGSGVVDGFSHGVGDDADDVNGCRTGIVSCIDRG